MDLEPTRKVKRGIPHVQSLKVIPETPDNWSGEGGGGRGGSKKGRKEQNVDGWD